MRTRWRHAGMFFGVLALMFTTVVPAASVETRDTSGTVKVKVTYQDANGDRQPLVGVEVFLFDNGTPRYACTNKKGKAKFENVTAASGVNVADRIEPPVDPAPWCPSYTSSNPLSSFDAEGRVG